MLNMGFVKDVTKIIEATPIERQLVLFSATTNQDVMTIAWKYQQDPVGDRYPRDEGKPSADHPVRDCHRARAQI